MKKSILASLLLVALFFTSCKKNPTTNLVSNETPKNEKITVKGEGGITVTAEDVYSNNTEFKRKITIFDSVSQTTLPSIFIKFTSFNKEVNIYEQLENDKSNVNGILIVEMEGVEILSQKIIDGKEKSLKRNKNFLSEIGPVYNKNTPCTARTVHDCVAYKIDGMNAVEYALCLGGAPACYLGTWAACGYDVCSRKIRYTNPNY